MGLLQCLQGRANFTAAWTSGGHLSFSQSSERQKCLNQPIKWVWAAHTEFKEAHQTAGVFLSHFKEQSSKSVLHNEGHPNTEHTLVLHKTWLRWQVLVLSWEFPFNLWHPRHPGIYLCSKSSRCIIINMLDQHDALDNGKLTNAGSKKDVLEADT